MNRPLQRLIGSSRFELAARYLVGLTFVYASFHKILAPAQFAQTLYGYHLFPAAAINLIAVILPFVELFCGLALILGIYPRSAAFLIELMLIAFMTALGINFVRGLEFDCGCFSFAAPGSRYTTLQLLGRGAVYFVLGLQVIFFSGNRNGCIRQTGSLFK